MQESVPRVTHRNSVIGVKTFATRLEGDAATDAAGASAVVAVAADRRLRSSASTSAEPDELLPDPLLGLTITPVDAVGLSERAADLAKRSIKTSAKAAALRLAVSCMDLTTLEGADTPGKVLSLCGKALRPELAARAPAAPSLADSSPAPPATPTPPVDSSPAPPAPLAPLASAPAPPVAAVCVYPELVPVAIDALSGTSVRVASVAGSFPAGLGPLQVRLEEIRCATAAGAHEIDIVLNRSAFLAGRYRQAFNEVAASKEAAGRACLKVILETGELGSYDAVRRASMLAMAAGADFIKTSTGKIGTSATLPAALCMAEALREFADSEGRLVGLKVAGGIRTAKESLQYLVVVAETLGVDWLTPRLFRIGASSLLNDVLLQLDRLRLGRYVRADKTLA